MTKNGRVIHAADFIMTVQVYIVGCGQATKFTQMPLNAEIPGDAKSPESYIYFPLKIYILKVCYKVSILRHVARIWPRG